MRPARSRRSGLGALRANPPLVNFEQQTSLAVSSPVAWSPDGSQFVYGLYDGTVAVAKTPAGGRPAVQASSMAGKP